MHTIEKFESCHFIVMPCYINEVSLAVIRLKTHASLEVIKVFLSQSNVTQTGPGFHYFRLYLSNVIGETRNKVSPLREVKNLAH